MHSTDGDYYYDRMGSYYCHPSAVEAPGEVDADAEGTEDTKTFQVTAATEVADVVEATAVPATLQDDKVGEVSEGDFVEGLLRQQEQHKQELLDFEMATTRAPEEDAEVLEVLEASAEAPAAVPRPSEG